MDKARCSLIDFGGMEVNGKKTVRFHITNHAQHSVLKFKFVPPKSEASISLVPLFGHIGPGKSKTIHATVASNKPISIERLGFACETHRIQYYDLSETEMEVRPKSVQCVRCTPSNRMLCMTVSFLKRTYVMSQGHCIHTAMWSASLLVQLT